MQMHVLWRARLELSSENRELSNTEFRWWTCAWMFTQLVHVRVWSNLYNVRVWSNLYNVRVWSNWQFFFVVGRGKWVCAVNLISVSRWTMPAPMSCQVERRIGFFVMKMLIVDKLAMSVGRTTPPIVIWISSSQESRTEAHATFVGPISN